MDVSRLVALLGCAIFLALPAQAQDPPSGRIPIVTRLVRIMTILEEELDAGMRSGSRAAVEPLLAEDFVVRSARAPGVPVPRAEWLLQSLAAPEPESQLSQMAVHEYGDVAVASFMRTVTPGTGTPSGAWTFTVDVWRKAGDSWKLATRYAAPANGAAPPSGTVGRHTPKRH